MERQNNYNPQLTNTQDMPQHHNTHNLNKPNHNTDLLNPFQDLTLSNDKIPLTNRYSIGGYLGANLTYNSCLETVAKKHGIRFFLLAYGTLNDDSKTCMIPTGGIKMAQKGGCVLCLAMYHNTTAVDPATSIVPDPTTLIQLPWQPAIAWVMGDIYQNGNPHPCCPRNTLKKLVTKAARNGFWMKAGVEPEFTLLDKDGVTACDHKDLKQPHSFNETFALMRRHTFLTKVHDVIEMLEWQPYRIDHEASSSQYEINYGYTDCLQNSDRTSFMKFMIKSLAEEEGLRATFMPVPFQDICSNGLHINLSLWNNRNENLFIDTKDQKLGISKICRNFIGGILDHVVESCAIFCPTMNSYKRLNNASWCPNVVTWGGENRTVLVRVPSNDRLEFRLSDGLCNPHLSHAFLLAAGLHGIQQQTDPGECRNKEVEEKDEIKLPTSLEAALNKLEESTWAKEWVGEEVVEAVVALKRKEIKEYSSHFCQWEKDYYINF